MAAIFTLAAEMETREKVIAMSENNGWISVKERMPELDTYCLVYSPDRGEYMACLKDANKYNRESARKHKDKWPVNLQWAIIGSCCYGSLFLADVTHWMPWPEPLQEIS